jgi:hypothetical protein
LLKRSLPAVDADGNDAGLGVMQPVLEEPDPAIDALITAIETQPIADWGIFSTGSPITAQAKKQDGTYRTVPLAGTEEFVFAGLHMGKRGKMIFQFRPIDPLYALYEFDETKVFEAVPALEAQIVGAINPKLKDPFDLPGEAYAAARSGFCAAFRRRVVEEKKMAEVELIKDNEKRQNENPIFGMF